MMDATGTGEENIILVTTPSTRMTVEGTKKLQCEVFSVPLDSVSESPIKINFLLAFPQEFGFNSFRLVLLLEISLPMKMLSCEDMRSFLLCDRTPMAGKQNHLVGAELRTKHLPGIVKKSRTLNTSHRLHKTRLLLKLLKPVSPDPVRPKTNQLRKGFQINPVRRRRRRRQRLNFTRSSTRCTRARVSSSSSRRPTRGGERSTTPGITVVNIINMWG